MSCTLVIKKPTNTSGYHINYNSTKCDTDSAKISIDNRCSACISHKIGDFIGPLKDINRSIKLFVGERLYNVIMVKIKQKLCDNKGKECTLFIPNYYYVIDRKIGLLLPQQWKKNQNDHTICRSEEKLYILPDNYYGTTETIPYIYNWENSTMLPCSYLATGYSKFDLF